VSDLTHRMLSREDVSAHQGWILAEWCQAIGGDEFTLSFISTGDPSPFCDEALLLLEPFAKSESEREVVYCRQERIRLWGLTDASLAVLRHLLPDGIFTYQMGDTGWVENFTIYRRGQMLLGVITHEASACLYLTEAEWQRFGELEICTHEPSA
jgi:hypothetical protein